MSRITARHAVAGVAAGALAVGGLIFPQTTAQADYTYTAIDQSKMRLVEVDSASVNEGANGAGALALDGDKNSYWHTEWQPNVVMPPHHITVRLADEAVQLGRVRLTPRQSSNGSGRARQYELWTANGDCSTATYAKVANGEFTGAVDQRAADQVITLAEPVAATCAKVVYVSSWGGHNAGETTSRTENVASLAEFNADAASGTAPTPTPTPTVTPPTGPEIVIPEGAVELTDGALKVRLHPGFPQVVDYRLGDKQLAGRIGDALTSVLINEASQNVTVAAPVKAADGKSATYALTFPNLAGVSVDAVASVKDGAFTLTFTNLVDPTHQVSRLRIPNHDLVTVTSDDAKAQLTAANMNVNRANYSDRFENVAETAAGNVTGSWMVMANSSTLAAAFDTNAIEDNTGPSSTSGRVAGDNNRFQRQIAQADGYKKGSVWAGTWVLRSGAVTKQAAAGKDTIGNDEAPFIQVKITGDANDDGIVDWQDAGVAARDIIEFGNGSDEVKNEVISRIPFNIVSQATHPFLRTLDDTKRISLATDNLGQKALLKGYQAEGHDAAHPDYAGHYNTRAGGLEDLFTLAEESESFNTSYGVHVNATESYSEAHAFSEDLLQMPPRKAWGWMNQSYYIDGPKDLATGNVLQRFQDFWDERPDNLNWLYMDVYYPDGWESQRFTKELAKQGWVIGSEWSDKMELDSVWSHWSQDENYGGSGNKGIQSRVIRFVYNTKRDTWNPDPILSNSNIVDFEGWTGHVSYNAFIKNVWERNLPVKFLQQSDIMNWDWKAGSISFANGTVATSPVESVNGTTIPTNRTITYDGATVYDQGAYLLPWKDGGEDRLYHHNIAGGETTWKLTDAWKSQSKLTVFKLTDTGRVKVGDVTPVDGSITLTAEKGVAYVLYPTSDVPAPVDPKWGQGSNINDPGFFSGTLDAYQSTGEVEVVKTDRGNFQAQFGAGESSLSQKLTLPAGDYSAWAWLEIEPGKQRAVTVEATGTGVKPAGYTTGSAGRAATSVSTTPVMNATASDEKLRTNFQRVRVTFTSTGEPVTLAFKVGGGSARVSVDDLRVVKFVAPADADKTPETVFYEDFENIDTGYFPFVTGATNAGGDARTQLAERHEPYSQKGWYGVNLEDKVVEGGKLNDNVLNGTWSLMANNENAGEILKTSPGNLPFKAGHKYRVSFDYQTTHADQYRVRVGHDTPTGSTFATTNVVTDVLGEQRSTATYTAEFTADTCDAYFVAIDKLQGRNTQHNMTIDDMRVEDLGVASDVTCVNGAVTIDGSSTVRGGEVRTVTTTVSSLEDGTLTGVTQELTGPEGWEIELLTAGADTVATGQSSTATWLVRIPRDGSNGTLKLAGSGTLDGKTVTVTGELPLQVIGANDIYLSDMQDKVVGTPSNGWGPVEWDQTNGEQGKNDGHPLTLQGVKYPKGIGVHANSTIEFDLAGECTAFHALVGVDDVQPRGTVQFEVLGDGVSLAKTEVLQGRGTPKPLDLDVTGVTKLTLRVTDGGNGNGNDHADWALARVTCGEDVAPEVAPVVTAPAKAEPGATVDVTVAGYAPTAETSIAEVYLAGKRVGAIEIDAEGKGATKVTLPSTEGQVKVEVRQWGAGISAATHPKAEATITVEKSVIVDTTKPVVTKIADQNGIVGTAYSFQVKATDASKLSYAAKGLPAGISIDKATGKISGTPTKPGASQVTVTVTDAAGNASSVSFKFLVKPKATQPQPKPYERTAPYTLPGVHHVNGRTWFTQCAKYSQTERCRTDIWASTVVRDASGRFVVKQGWSFNNLTYLPYMTRQQWGMNPLAYTNTWTAEDGRMWRTECDTAVTGGNGCRSYIWSTVVSAKPKAGGGYTFTQKDQWVFNNIVMFR